MNMHLRVNPTLPIRQPILSQILPLLSACIISCLCTSCASLNKNAKRVEAFALPSAQDGLLVQTSDQVLAGYEEDQSAFLLLPHNTEALQWRLALIDHAQSSIDVKYFIWEGDEAGSLLLSRLVQAAQRGVRVRLLLDDMVLSAPDDSIALLASLENMDVRVYNPVINRGWLGSKLEFLAVFRELNQRMHNKMMTVDGQWAILGGRNVGNAYFGMSPKYNFRDLDVLITGPIVKELGHAYDEYWNSPTAYPGSGMARPSSGKKRQRILKRMGIARQEADRILMHTPFPIQRRDWSAPLSDLPDRMVPGTAEYYHDAPDVKPADRIRMLGVLAQDLPPVTNSAVYISPYFLPSKDMLKGMKNLSDRDVNVTLLTASLAANNHTSVHSHYKKYRRRILASGADLYEFDHRPVPETRSLADTEPIVSSFISIHVKAGVFDGNRVILGSLNLDPRAMDINTENVMVIHSQPFAAQVDALVNELTAPGNAWRVTHDERLLWTSGDQTRRSTPARSFGQRITDFFLRLLPIEGQL